MAEHITFEKRTYDSFKELLQKETGKSKMCNIKKKHKFLNHNGKKISHYGTCLSYEPKMLCLERECPITPMKNLK